MTAQLDFTHTSMQTMHHGDCLEIMRTMLDNSIDFIVTDPPYGLHFMGKDWDKFNKSNFDENGKHSKAIENGKERNVRTIATGNSYAGTYDDLRNDEFQEFIRTFGTEALRILKPGSHIAMFGSPRRHHRQMSGLEDAGFEIRDVCIWLFGQGFPKSHDISKAIDKSGGNPGLIDEISTEIKKSRESRNLTVKECDDRFCNSSTNWYWFEGRPSGKHLPSDKLFETICKEWNELYKYFEKVKDLNRDIIPTTGNLHKGTGNTIRCFTGTQKSNIPISNLSEKFSGYGTALKPAHEPIILAMKPLDGTYAQNAQKWGVAGINIDDSRIETNEILQGSTIRNDIRPGNFGSGHKPNPGDIPNYKQNLKGRWPANLILDEEAADMLDQQTDNASRFFYCAKASSSERNKGLDKPCSHPTVKPIAIMKYIIKLLAPPNNPILLDPFAGSGTTLLAAKQLDINAIGIEKEEEYYNIAKARVEHA